VKQRYQAIFWWILSHNVRNISLSVMQIFTDTAFILSVKYLPDWAPGAGFLKQAKEWRKVLWNATRNPYEWCKKNLVSMSHEW